MSIPQKTIPGTITPGDVLTALNDTITAINNQGISKECVAPAAVTAAAVAPDAVGVEALQESSIISAHIQDAQIQTAHIEDAAITHAKIEDAAITTAKIADAAITNAKIEDATIEGAKIASATIGGANIKNAAIDTANIKQGAISTALLGIAVVGDAQIDRSSANKLQVVDADIVSVTASKLTAGTIDAGAITVKNLNAENITTGTINGQRIGDGAITSSKIGADAVDNSKIADGAVKNENIFAGTISGDRLVADTITGREIAAGSISANEMVAGTITAASGILADACITTAKIADGQITTAKIGDAQITSAKIGNLDAGKIASGKLTVGTAGAQRTEIFGFGGTPYIDMYDGNSRKRSTFNYDGLTFYNSDQVTVSARIASTTEDTTLTVGSGKQFASPQAAIDSLPTLLNHNVLLDLYSGTYDDLAIAGFMGKGALQIITHEGETVHINSITCDSVVCSLEISGSVIIDATSKDGVFISGCTNVVVVGLVITGATSNYSNGITVCYSNVYISSCQISNKYYGVYVIANAIVRLDNASGTGNSQGVTVAYGIFIDGGDNTLPYLVGDGALVIPSAGLKASGTGAKLVTATGTLTNGNLMKWDANGNAVDSGMTSANLGWSADNITWQSGWTDYGGSYAFAYSKDNNGVIRLRGLIKSGTVGQAALQLPLGFRPSWAGYYPVATYGYGSAVVRIAMDGTITVMAGSSTWISLAGISFR